MRLANISLLLLLILSLSFSCSNSSQSNAQTEAPGSAEARPISPKDRLSKTGTWVSLFNGENLDGWEIKSGDEMGKYDFWSVQDGAILANSMGESEHDYSWLISTQEFADFELKVKFQSFRDSPGNSGVQIRSRFDEEGMGNGSTQTGYLDGPQIDIHPPGAWRTGYVYDETRGHQRWIDPDLPDWNMDQATYEPEVHRHYYSDEAPYWNELIVICKGNQITTFVNDILVSDFDGAGVLDDAHHQKRGIDKKGFIALQLHKRDELKIAFKDIEIKEL